MTVQGRIGAGDRKMSQCTHWAVAGDNGDVDWQWKAMAAALPPPAPPRACSREPAWAQFRRLALAPPCDAPRHRVLVIDTRRRRRRVRPLLCTAHGGQSFEHARPWAAALHHPPTLMGACAGGSGRMATTWARTSPQTLKAIYASDTRPERRAKGEGYTQKARGACKGQGQRAEGAREADSTASVQTAGEGPARTCCPRALKTGLGGNTHFRHAVLDLFDVEGPMHSYKRAFKAATKSAMNRAAPAQVQRPSTQASPVSPIPKEGYNGPRALQDTQLPIGMLAVPVGPGRQDGRRCPYLLQGGRTTLRLQNEFGNYKSIRSLAAHL
ncbi:hypothetical protein GGX14DRAFT_404833 [Mycena pura]|uniref:Uncharacterized protein n=1 Tax=Mycena pura TaxID=153505 RepID=A0AAD6Y4V7_9AGAR|nr:hypothetical protein GGX14DRAFT_404833 [Mycena pura]